MRKRHGFTLLEMGIVLAISALLVAGVISAQTMGRTAKLKNMLSEYDSYVKAIAEFQDKYHALPGDMTGVDKYSPQDMWGTDPCGCPCANSTTKTAATCNGDGNGDIGNSTAEGVVTSNNGATPASYEWFRAWQHLSNAGFISGTFTGTPGPGGVNEATLGVNVPASAVTGAGWSLLYFLLPTAIDGPLWPDQYGHLLTLGRPVSGDFTWGPALTSAEAFNIDTKMDDGKPGTGRIRAFRMGKLQDCTVNDSSQTAQTYKPADANDNTPTCSLVFVLGF